MIAQNIEAIYEIAFGSESDMNKLIAEIKNGTLFPHIDEYDCDYSVMENAENQIELEIYLSNCDLVFSEGYAPTAFDPGEPASVDGLIEPDQLLSALSERFKELGIEAEVVDQSDAHFETEEEVLQKYEYLSEEQNIIAEERAYEY